MTLTLEIPDDVKAGLQAQADVFGLTLPQYVQRLLEQKGGISDYTALSPAQRAALWRESVKGQPLAPPLSEEAISRESIYGDRG